MKNIFRSALWLAITSIVAISCSNQSGKKSADTLKSWIDRIVNNTENSEINSIDDFKKVLTPFMTPPSIKDDKDFYADYGSDDSYHTKTGKAACDGLILWLIASTSINIAGKYTNQEPISMKCSYIYKLH